MFYFSLFSDLLWSNPLPETEMTRSCNILESFNDDKNIKKTGHCLFSFNPPHQRFLPFLFSVSYSTVLLIPFLKDTY